MLSHIYPVVAGVKRSDSFVRIFENGSAVTARIDGGVEYIFIFWYLEDDAMLRKRISSIT